MNRRNADYILPNNPRTFYPRVDDKLITKQICDANGIPVPKTFGVIHRQGDIRRLDQLLGEHREFVIKPTQGSEGRGILVIADRSGDDWVAANGQLIAAADARYHLSAILAGLYSLSGRPDRVVIEQRIGRHPAFREVAMGGTPDVRVIVYRGVPAMAMVRLPTRASRGKANLHQGAVGAGIDLQSGQTVGGVCGSRAVDVHPDTGKPIAGLRVPFWDELLTAAVRLADSIEMGYIGVDFVLDEKLGPIVLEANARPGLSIQIANRAGLVPRLHAIDTRKKLQTDTEGRPSRVTGPLPAPTCEPASVAFPVPAREPIASPEAVSSTSDSAMPTVAACLVNPSIAASTTTPFAGGSSTAISPRARLGIPSDMPRGIPQGMSAATEEA